MVICTVREGFFLLFSLGMGVLLLSESGSKPDGSDQCSIIAQAGQGGNGEKVLYVFFIFAFRKNFEGNSTKSCKSARKSAGTTQNLRNEGRG